MKTIVVFAFAFLFTFKICLSQWFAVDTGFTDDYVEALFIYNNKLYIGGQFDVLPNHSTAIYSWDGVNLVSVSPPLQGNVSSITKYANDLVAFGVIKQFQSTTIPNGTVRWDGANWYNLGAGITDMGEILAAAAYQGSLFVGGRFSYIENIYRRCIARWDGSQWNSVGIGLSAGLSDIQSMVVYNGELYIGGYFSSIDGVNASCIARFDGINWVQVAAGLNGTVKCLFVDSTSNRLYASGNFNSSGVIPLPSNIAYYDGINWNPFANNQSMYPLSVCTYKNQLYAGFASKLTNAVGDTLHYIARYDGTDWQPLDNGLNTTPKTMIVFNDDLIVGGFFTTAGSITANRIARWHYSPNAIKENVLPSSKDFEIIPNPSRTRIKIKSHFPIKGYTLINQAGKQIESRSLNSIGNVQIDVSALSNGIYFVNLLIGEVLVSKSFVKE